MFDIRLATKKVLDGCIIRSDSGVDMFTPDGMANYAALWTRDFAYMLSYAQELMDPEKCLGGLEYLLSHTDTNGWIPDRVDAQGVAAYTAGNPSVPEDNIPASPNLDNGSFLVIAADAYLKTLPTEQAKAFFVKWEKALRAGIDCLPKNADGMIFNDANPPHSPYGFTDKICKTGALAKETLLLWKALGALIHWQKAFTRVSEAYILMKESIEKTFLGYFWAPEGMLFATTEHCRQIDVWASCYMLAIDFPVKQAQKDAIVCWLKTHYDGIIYKGQMRHLPQGQYWEKMLVDVPKNTYQNGAFWATPIIWFVQAVMEQERELAKKTVLDALEFFENKGIFECVYVPDDYYKLDTYVTSATNVYAAAKLLGLI